MLTENWKTNLNILILQNGAQNLGQHGQVRVVNAIQQKQILGWCRGQSERKDDPWTQRSMRMVFLRRISGSWRKNLRTHLNRVAANVEYHWESPLLRSQGAPLLRQQWKRSVTSPSCADVEKALWPIGWPPTLSSRSNWRWSNWYGLLRSMTSFQPAVWARALQNGSRYWAWVDCDDDWNEARPEYQMPAKEWFRETNTYELSENGTQTIWLNLPDGAKWRRSAR